MVKKLLLFALCAFSVALYSCAEDGSIENPEDDSTTTTTPPLESIETVLGEVSKVIFNDDSITLSFASGTKLDFAYPEAIFPYIGDNDNWWINGKDTGLPSTGAAGADGEDGKDGVDGENGQDGADGEDGKDGVDGENGQNGADGEDGKDGADGVGIESITYDNGKLTITLTDGTKNQFTLGVTGSGSLEGTNDYLTDENPMLLSAISCGDIEMMNFDYDAQNRLVGAKYNTIVNNAPAVLGKMEREYDRDGFKSVTTFSRLAQYDGETDGDDYMYDVSYGGTNLVDFASEYTTAELFKYLFPQGVRLSVEYDDGNGPYSKAVNYNYGEPIDSKNSEFNSILDRNMLAKTNYFLDNKRWQPIRIYSDLKMYYIYIYDLVSNDYERNNNRYKACIIEFRYDEWRFWDGSPVFLVENFKGTDYVKSCNVLKTEVNTTNMYGFGYGGNSLDVNTDGSVNGDLSGQYESSTMVIPVVDSYDYFQPLLGKSESPVKLLESGDGYKKYKVYNKLVDDSVDQYIYHNAKYIIDGKVVYGYELDRPLYTTNSREYVVYEKGIMMEGVKIYCANDDNDYRLYYEECELDGDGYSSAEDDAVCVVMDEANNRVSKIQYWSLSSAADVTSIDYIYNAAGSLTSLTLTLDDGTKYADLFEVKYDDKSNPTEVVAYGAEIKALDDEEIDELMAVIGVAVKRSTLNIETGDFDTTYSYNESGATSVIKLSYNYDYKNFFGNTLEAINLLPMGLTMNNAIEEIKWAGHASYLFTDYSGFSGQGYPESAKMFINVSPLDLDGYSSPALSGVSVGVDFEYVQKK